MKICITSSGDTLESQVDPRFGRCRYFIIWDDENDTFEAISNPNIDAGSGAGIQSAQMVVAKNVSMIITGEIGPKAEQVLTATNLQVVTGASGTIKEAIEKHRNNDVKNMDTYPQKKTEMEETTEGWFRQGIRRCFGFFSGRGVCGRGMGMRMGKRGASKGFGKGQGGFCICLQCGEKQPHQRGIPCGSIKCSKCGSIMVRD